MSGDESLSRNPDSTAGSKAEVQDTLGLPVTLPKHLELFAQAIADGRNVREAAKRSGRKEGSGGYLNSRADVKQCVAQIRATMAKTCENEAATEMVGQWRLIDIDRNEELTRYKPGLGMKPGIG